MVGFFHGLVWLAFVAMTVIIRPDIGWTWGYTALVVLTGPIGGVLVLWRLRRRRREKCSYLRDRPRKVADRTFVGAARTEEQEHAAGHRLARGRLERERVRRALESVARDLGVEIGLVAPRVGLVVDDHQAVGACGRRGRRSPRACAARPGVATYISRR